MFFRLSLVDLVLIKKKNTKKKNKENTQLLNLLLIWIKIVKIYLHPKMQMFLVETPYHWNVKLNYQKLSGKIDRSILVYLYYI